MSENDVPDREISTGVLKHICLNQLFMPIVIVAILWGMFATHVWSGGVTRRGSTRSEIGTVPYMIVTIVATLGTAGFGWWKISRALSLARHGIEVTGVIQSTGSFSKKGLVNVEYEYQIGVRKIRKKMSAAQGLYTRGDEISLLVDPRNKDRCIIKSEVLPMF